MKILLEIVILAGLSLILSVYYHRKLVFLAVAQRNQIIVLKRSVKSPKIKERVQEMLSENRWVRSNRPRGEVPGLLKGVLRCGHCDCTMGPTYSRKGSRHYRYYLCQGAAKKGYKTCPTKSLPADEAERMVVDKLRALLKSPEMVVATFQSASRAAKDHLAEIVRLLPEQERILSRLQAESDRLLSGTARHSQCLSPAPNS